MKALHDQARRVIAEGNAADVAASGSEERNWQALCSRLDAPLPPGAAAADQAMRLAGAVGSGAGASALLKLALWGALLGGLAGGLVWYEARQAVNTPAAPLRPLAPASLAPTIAPPLPLSAAEASPTAGASQPDAERPVGRRPRRAEPKPPSLSEETLLIAEAQSALNAGDAARALGLLDQHRRESPNGALQPEREAARVLSLCALQREAEARAARQRFERSWPTSPLLSRVRASCASE